MHQTFCVIQGFSAFPNKQAKIVLDISIDITIGNKKSLDITFAYKKLLDITFGNKYTCSKGQ